MRTAKEVERCRCGETLVQCVCDCASATVWVVCVTLQYMSDGKRVWHGAEMLAFYPNAAGRCRKRQAEGY